MCERSGIRIAQSEEYEGDEWWSWAVWLDGSEAELRNVDYVEYTLHSTFPDPVRKVATRRNKFKLSAGGWGVFPIHARVVLKTGKVKRLKHLLKLHYPSGKQNLA